MTVQNGVHLYIGNMNINSLKDYFEGNYKGDPDEIVVLECFDNNLVNLEGCPRNVRELWCHRNLLESLEGCPPNLEKLYCHHNYLTNLRECPSTVKRLWCQDNDLTTLYGCPAGVTELLCYNNELVSLDFAPPNYKMLQAKGNPLDKEWHCLTDKERRGKISMKRMNRGLAIVKRMRKQKIVQRFCDNLLDKWYTPDENGFAPYAMWTWKQFQSEINTF